MESEEVSVYGLRPKPAYYPALAILTVDTVSPNEPQPLSSGLWFIFFLVCQHAISNVHQFSHRRAQC